MLFVADLIIMTRAASTSPLVLVVFLVTMGNVAGRVAADLGIPGKSWPTKRTTDTEFEALAESEPNLQRATFGAGCYWGTEKYFADNMETKCPGCVRATSVGFMGPTQPKEGEYPTYNEVCTGRTGHVEVVQIVYDKSVCTFEQLNEHLYTFHDPTTKNRQGNDHGPQYASVVFAHDAAQKRTAEKVKAKVQKALDAGEIKDFAGKLVNTAVEDATVFFPAHEDHQRYLEKRPQGYCNHRQRFSWEGVKLGKM